MPWGLIIGAALSAAAAAKASSDARRARLSQQSSQDSTSELDYARQKEFAQNSIQWRVADAKAAGLHPLYALGGAGSSYQPPTRQAFAYDPGPTLALGNALGRGGGAIADYYSREASRSSELYGPPYDYTEPVATSWSVKDPGETQVMELPPSDFGNAVPYGMVSHERLPTMAYWQIPEIGEVIAPYNKEKDFSQALEGVESPIGQGLILYLNRGLGKRALEWLYGQFKKKAGSIPSLLSLGADAAKTYLDSHRR